jgi:opacity protein-like surface antigen
MKNYTNLKSIVLVAAASLGLASSSFAQTTVPATEPAPVARPSGLLGQNYAALSYGFLDLDDSGVDANSVSLGFNQAIRDGLDSMLEYDYTRTDRILGSRLTQHSVLIGARAFTNYNGIKPYAEAGVGWVWQKFGGASDNSFAWGAGVGAEFELAPAFTLTPFVRYTDITEGSNNDAWEYGLKTNYWLTEKLALSGGISRDDDSNMLYRVGVNFRY